jgi:hypothetical protein
LTRRTDLTAALFLEKVSPALEHVDSSSGAIGNTVNRGSEELVPVIAAAPADLARRSNMAGAAVGGVHGRPDIALTTDFR